jgi:hypothetical protein
MFEIRLICLQATETHVSSTGKSVFSYIFEQSGKDRITINGNGEFNIRSDDKLPILPGDKIGIELVDLKTFKKGEKNAKAE